MGTLIYSGCIGKFAELLKIITIVKAGLNAFFIVKPEYMLNLCLRFDDSQSIYAYKRYAVKKRV